MHFKAFYTGEQYKYILKHLTVLRFKHFHRHGEQYMCISEFDSKHFDVNLSSFISNEKDDKLWKYVEIILGCFLGCFFLC